MKKNYKEFLFTLFIIIVFFYTIYYYFGLSLKANDEILKIDLIAKNKNINLLNNSFNSTLEKKHGDLINHTNNGITIIDHQVPYQSCFKIGINITNFTYFAIGNTIVKKYNDPPNRDLILKECYNNKSKNIFIYYSN